MFWATRGFSTEGRGWLKAALDRAAQIPRGDGEEDRQMLAARAKGLTGYSQTFYGMGDYQGALDAGLEATGLYRELGSRFELAYGLGIVGNMAAFQNDPDLAERALTEAVQIGRELNSSLVLCFALGVLSHYVLLPRGNIAAARSTIEESIRHAKVIQMPWAVAQGDMVLGHLTAILGQWDKARQYALKAAAIFEATRDSGTVIMAYNLLADIEIHLGNLDEARRILNECLVSGQKTGLQAFVSQSLEGLAYLARAEELPIRTARLLGAAEAVREGLGTSVISIHRLVNEYEQTTAWLHEQLDEPEYERYWREGCGMSQAEAVAYALEKDE
jgi:tetratricopeptide (TPR) repeat protein